MDQKKNKKIPMRTCVGCRESKPKQDLVRMVALNGTVIVDKTGKANGRGIYLCQNEVCFESALKKKAINRGLKLELTDEALNMLSDEFLGNKE